MPTITFEIPAAMTANVRGQSHTVEGVDQWPVESLAAIFDYGFQRRHNDACGSVGLWQDKDGKVFMKESDADGLTKRPAESVLADCLAQAQKVSDNLSKGILRAVGERISDPVRALAVDLAETTVLKALREAHPNESASALEKRFDIRAAAVDLVNANGDKNAYLAMARTTLAEQAKIKANVNLANIKTRTPKPKAKAEAAK